MDGLLKFITCGSVDDGKSTLIGHMLYDAKLLFTDHWTILCCWTVCWQNGSRELPLTLLTVTLPQTAEALS